jgi:hypothetical protein
MCEAHVQGNSHFNRGRIYQAYLEILGYPEHHTIDYIGDVWHDDLMMFKVSVDRCLERQSMLTSSLLSPVQAWNVPPIRREPY